MTFSEPMCDLVCIFRKMRISLLLILLFCNPLRVFAQSPFNYGQNRKVYFISAEMRNKLGIEHISSVQQLPEGQKGGMGENWSVNMISFDKDVVRCDWSPLSLDRNFRYNFDSLLNSEPLNGVFYEFSEGQLIASGGTGYGSFINTEITRWSDSVSVAELSCAGHCGGSQPSEYKKMVYAESGRLLYSVTYPTPTRDDEQPVDEEFLTSGIGPDRRPDTVFYKYDAKGLYTGTNKDKESQADIKGLFHKGGFPNLKFNQCYVGKVKMETYFLEKLGYTPELVLIEIYRQGVFSFLLNPATRKYYETNSIELD